MKQLISGFVFTLFSISLFAQGNISKCCTNSLVDIGGNYTRSQIKPNGRSDFDGNMGGLQAMYQYRPIRCVYAALGGHWRYGKNTGDTGTRDLTDAGVHERIGYTFSMRCNQVLLTPYTGFGYRYLNHHVKPNSGSELKLYYNEFYFPLGIQSVYDSCNWLSVGLDFTWMPQVFSTVTFNVTDDARWKLKNTYKNFHVAVPFYFDLRCMRGWDVVLKPFFEYWQDGRTLASTQFNDPLGLPENTYTFWGIELNLQYAF